MAKSPWLGLLGIAGGLAYLAIPHSETYSDYGLGINSVDIECGNSFDSKVDVHFENPDEQYYWNSYDRIFDGKTAEEVCQKLDGDARPLGWGLTAVGGVWLIGGLALSMGRRSSANATSVVRPPAAVPSPTPTPAATAPAASPNPARWVADPTGRFEMRYWDGAKWTNHVANGADTFADPVNGPARPAPAPAAAAAPAGASSLPVPVQAPPAEATPVIENLADHDGRTISRASLASVHAPSFTLRFDDGSTLEVSDGTLVGRNPEPASGEPQYRCVQLADESSTVSKTHLLIEVVDGTLMVTDRHSSNGTVLHTGAGSQTLQPMQPSPVAPGTRVELGDRWFSVEQEGH
ncbi:MAG: DUF2510 domain-containing protein [Acidimicrobiaceae bacterium]|nr:DUF2510 domain-containing protein [Acidimicrobiaceae bacterium]